MSALRARRSANRAVLSTCLTIVAFALWQPAGWTQAQPSSGDEETITVETAVEAWYHTTPLPPGDLGPLAPPPTNPYEQDTLHVRITAGQENARTYLGLKLTKLPLGARITEGFLTLPLVPTEEETEDDKTARVEACSTSVPSKSVSGSFDEPPKVDCKVRSPALYFAKPKPHLVVNLAPFSKTLQTSGLALRPSARARDASDTWHVAFYGRKNKSKPARPITASISFVVDEVEPPAVIEPEPLGGGGGGGGLGSGFGISADTPALEQGGAPPADAPAGAAQAPEAAPELPESAAPAAAVAPKYTIVWALPLGLLLLAGYFSSALTREIVVSRRSSG